MIKKSLFSLKSSITLFLLATCLFTNLNAAAPSNINGWTFFVRITEGGFGMGEDGSFLLCLAQNEARMVNLSNIDDITGPYTYSASGSVGTITMGSFVMTFVFTDDRRGNYDLIRGGAVAGGYQLGKFSATGGTAPASLTNSILDFKGRRGDMPLAVNYRLLTGDGNTYSKMDGSVRSPSNGFAVEKINGSTTRLYFNDAVLGSGHTHLMFISPTTGLFAFKIAPGKAYEQGTFALHAATPPSITRHPTNQMVAHGETASFSVTATGFQPLSYQWLKNGVAITGATQSQLVISNVSAQDQGKYKVIVSSFLGSDESNDATLTPLCPTRIGNNFAWFDYRGGTGKVQVVESDCAWRAINTNNWIQIVSGQNTFGAGELVFSVSTNANATPRTGHIRVGTKLFKVAQQATYAPNTLAGMTLRTDRDIGTEGSPTNVVEFYAMNPGRTNHFYFSTLAGADTNRLTYGYQRTSETTASASFFPDTTMILTFSNFTTGHFTLTNTATNSSSQGLFYISQRRGDVTFDGYPDLRWQSTNGRVRIRFTDGDFVTNAVVITNSSRLVGVSDFTRDGKLDLVFFATQQVLFASTGSTNPMVFRGGAKVNNDWRVVTTEDLSGDDFPEILFQHKDGRLAYWQIGGATNYFNRAVTVRGGKPAAINWVAVGAADINGDREEDILLMNLATRQTAAWYFNNGDFVNVELVGGTNTMETNWLVRAVADMDSDGQNDLLWQNKTNGLVRIWHMNGTNKLDESEITNPPADPAWTLIGPK